jgi:mono/diheme cytochrome c family protein
MVLLRIMRLGVRSLPMAFSVALLLSLSVSTARAADTPEMIARGEYLARAGDCVSCHTAPGGKPFAGGLLMETPFGSISTPNLTPDKTTGIGDWTDDEFYRALHEGIGRHGEYLYPVFPFPWYTNVTRDDVLAIKAYLFSLPA